MTLILSTCSLFVLPVTFGKTSVKVERPSMSLICIILIGLNTDDIVSNFLSDKCIVLIILIQILSIS